MPQSVQAGSTLTIHDVSHLGNPDAHLARMYSSSWEHNIAIAFEAKRLDHAEVFATLHGLLADPPPPHSRHPPLSREVDLHHEREMCVQEVMRKKVTLDKM